MGDIRETGYNLPTPNFPQADASSNIPTEYYDFARNVNRSRKRRREFNYLNKKNNQYFNSHLPVVDLTGNNGQFENRRIPLIDLTDEDVMDITDQIQCIDLTNDYSLSNNQPNRHFELKRKIDSSRNNHANHHFENKKKIDASITSHSNGHIELTRHDDSFSTSHLKRHLELTRNDDSSNNSHLNHHFELAGNIDSSSNIHPKHHFEHTRNDDSFSNSHLKRYLELTRNGDSSNNSQVNHHFELTGNSDSSSNSLPKHHFELARNDDSSSNSHPNHQFELTSNDDSSSNNHPNHQFELTRNVRDTNGISERFNLADHNSQNFIPNVPASDLSCYNDEFTNYRIPNRTHNNEQNITHQLQYTGLKDGKQERNVSNCIPTTTLTYDIGQSIDQTIPPINLTLKENYENYSRPIFDLPPDNTGNIVHNAEGVNLTDQLTPSTDPIRSDTVDREPTDIAGMYDAEVRSCNNLPTNCSKPVPEINPIIPFESPRYDVTEFNIVNCNEASNMNFMQISTSSRMQPYQCRKKIILKNSHPQTNVYHQKDLKPGKYVKILHNNASDLLKPARHPIPFRHSMGRSTVNTSKNVPIESTETSKGGSRTMTVSSTIRRKKPKSSSGIPKQNLSNSLINFRNQLQEQTHFPLELLKNFF